MGSAFFSEIGSETYWQQRESSVQLIALRLRDL